MSDTPISSEADVYAYVVFTIAAVFGVDEKHISRTTAFKEQYALGGFDGDGVIFRLENHYKIFLPSDVRQKCTTVQDLVTLIIQVVERNQKGF